MYAKSKLQVACEYYGIDPQQLGTDHRYVFQFTSFSSGSQQAPPIRLERPCLIVSLMGQPSDGAAASYAGLSLQFQYAGRDFASDGQTAQPIPFGVLFGNQSHPEHEFKIPLLMKQADSIYARVFNNTGGPLTPSVVCRVVNLKKG